MKQIIKWRESGHFCKITVQSCRQIVPTFAASISGPFASPSTYISKCFLALHFSNVKLIVRVVCCFLCVGDVRFVHFGELVIRYLHIARFRYGKYMLINSGRLRLVFVCDLKYPRVITSNMLF